MGSFLTTGFPNARWANTDSAADLAAAINSIDSAIRFVMCGGSGVTSIDFAALTRPIKLSDGLLEVLDNFKIGAGEIVDDIVDTIPLIPGMNEDHELATVEALRAFIVAYSLDWGEDLYIPIITTPTAGNFPVMDANGELATSSYNQNTWITRIVGPIAGNIPLMQPDGLLMASAWDPADWVAVTGDIMTGNLTMSGADIIIGTGGRMVKLPHQSIEEQYGYLDQHGLHLTTDIGVTHSSLHLGAENSDPGVPYFRDAAGNHYEVLHKGNFGGTTGFNAGAIHAKKAVPGNSGATWTSIAMDTTLATQGAGSTIFSLSSGKIKVAYAGLYIVNWQIYMSDDVQVRLKVSNTDMTWDAYGGAEIVTGENTFAEMTGLFMLGANDELEFFVQTPSGTVAINGNAATIFKVGVDGAAS